MREIVHIQAGQCGNQIGAKVNWLQSLLQNKKINTTFFKSFGKLYPMSMVLTQLVHIMVILICNWKE
jgi:hypothetical protein